MTERQAFSFETMRYTEQDEPFTFEEFVSQVTALCELAFAEVTLPDGDLAPLLIVGNRGEIDLITWVLLTEEYQEHFVDQVVPTTLGSLDVSIVALMATSDLNPLPGSPPDLERQEVLLLSVMDEHKRELALAAPIIRTADQPPQLDPFAVIQEALAPAFRRALWEGIKPD